MIFVVKMYRLFSARRRGIFGVLVCFVWAFLLGLGPVRADNALPFDQWLHVLQQDALAQNISAETVTSILNQVALIPRVIKADRTQAEFKESYYDYLTKRVSPQRVERGREYMKTAGAEIASVTDTFGVPARFVVSILGVETNFGHYRLPYSAFDVLVTLAYDSRRGKRFRDEVFAALKMVDKGYARAEDLRSSWAGALGHPQFMPTTYLQFAQDFDGDGRKNIWQPNPDLYASVAKYLSHYGWQNDEAWARKVVLPQGKLAALVADTKNRVEIPAMCQRYHKHLVGWKSLAQWNDLGVRRMNGDSLPTRDMAAALIVTREDYNHGYLVYRNFCALMRYNPSFKYALSVGLLSDALK